MQAVSVLTAWQGVGLLLILACFFIFEQPIISMTWRRSVGCRCPRISVVPRSSSSGHQRSLLSVGRAMLNSHDGYDSGSGGLHPNGSSPRRWHSEEGGWERSKNKTKWSSGWFRLGSDVEWRLDPDYANFTSCVCDKVSPACRQTLGSAFFAIEPAQGQLLGGSASLPCRMY